MKLITDEMYKVLKDWAYIWKQNRYVDDMLNDKAASVIEMIGS